ncbi:hypothetical protein [Stenotrophomonas mori]|uniref:Uncharacterized protein n=1 Tax=Stenotrophomonas mori TaxID=2871096 RepID=A0ABT0SI92_9GAMM|nr:hypothetical protein [Stenotrophomonas mori]MCL7714710.1 hypothetical protein [Stenotrophomonas mori]
MAAPATVSRLAIADCDRLGGVLGDLVNGMERVAAGAGQTAGSLECAWWDRQAGRSFSLQARVAPGMAPVPVDDGSPAGAGISPVPVPAFAARGGTAAIRTQADAGGTAVTFWLALADAEVLMVNQAGAGAAGGAPLLEPLRALEIAGRLLGD